MTLICHAEPAAARRIHVRKAARAIVGAANSADAAWDWMANMVRAGYRESAIVESGYSFRVVRTLNVQP